MVSIDQIKKLRQETGISISECKKALEETEGDFEEAKEVLRKWGKELADKKSDRETGEGIIESYIHPNKKIGVLVNLRCETDFVARSKDFQKLAHELCLQIAAMNPLFLKEEDVPKEDKDKDKEGIALMSQPWIRDETKTVKELIDEYIAKLGENIMVKRFVRYEI